MLIIAGAHRSFSGIVTFTYNLTDGVSPTKPTATVTLNVTSSTPVPADPVPVAVDDSYTALFDQPFSPAAGSFLLVNDTAAAGRTKTAGNVVSGPTGGAGTVSMDASGNGNFTFTPTLGWSGEREREKSGCWRARAWSKQQQQRH